MSHSVFLEPSPARLRFRRAPLAAAAAWFALGILLARFTPHATVHVVAALVVLLTIATLAIRSRLAWFPVAALWITLGIAAADWQPQPPIETTLLASADNLSRTVRGHVLRVRAPATRVGPFADPTAGPSSGNRDADTVPPWEATDETLRQPDLPLALDLAVDELEQVTPDRSTMVPASGGVRVSVYGLVAGVGVGADFRPDCGDRLELPLRLKPLDHFRTPGAFDYASYLAGQGIAVRANTTAAQVVRLGHAPASARCGLYAAQAWASGRLAALAGLATNRRLPGWLRLGDVDIRMLDAMLFGDRSGVTPTLRTGFERTGTFHLFVVSGLHIALVAAGLWWCLGRLRLHAWPATLLTLAGTGAYAALTGFGQPAQRALTMTAVFLLARLLARDRDPVNALGAAVLALLVLSPASLFDASFEMTALVILAIAGIAQPLAARTPLADAGMLKQVFVGPRRVFAPRLAQRLLMLELWGEALARLLPRALRARVRQVPAWAVRVAMVAGELMLVSVVAELVMALPMAVFFHRLTVFSVPANVLILPLIGVLVPAAVLTFAVSLLSPQLAMVPAVATAGLLHAITLVIGRLSGLASADVRLPGPAWWVAGTAVLGWMGCCWLARRGRIPALGAALALPVLAVFILWPEPPQVTPGVLEVTALDVGQGDSLLAVNPEGAAMLIDAGGPIGARGQGESVAAFDVGEQVVAPYLWSRHFRRLDVVVLSHAHTDHMGGMPAVLEDLRPRELWVGIDVASPLYAALLARARSLGITVRHLHAGDRVRWGPVEALVLAPAAGYSNAGAPRNDDSLVLELRFGKASVLLEGDAERPSEDAMVESGRLGAVTLLKVGHHGSRTSSNPEFLDRVRPQQAVISVGRGNAFGHPRAEVIERLAALDTRVYRTDLFGLRTFLLSPDGRIRDGP